MISNDYVQTGLLTGKAWDRTCHWIEDYIKTLNADSSLTKSQYYGNYKNSQSPANVTGYGSKQVAGFSDKWSVKNIYDLAGNVWEWTSEALSPGRLNRGGNYYHDGERFPVSWRRLDGPSNTDDNLGFRSRLYIK